MLPLPDQIDKVQLGSRLSEAEAKVSRADALLPRLEERRCTGEGGGARCRSGRGLKRRVYRFESRDVQHADEGASVRKGLGE